MEFKTAVTTQVLGSVPVTFVDVTAGRTLLRGVPGIDGDNLLTKILGLVPDKLFQFVERPVVEFPIELSTATFLNTDLGEVFKCEYRRWGLNNLLRDTMVDISHKPSFSTSQLPQFADTGSSAFELEFGSEMRVFTTSILHCLGIKKRVIGADRDVDNPPVNSENALLRDRLRGVGFKLTMQVKRIVVLSEGQSRRFNIPRKILSVIFRDTKRYLDSTIRCRDGCISGIKAHPDNSGIVSHRRILFTKRFKMAFHRFQRLTRNIPRALHKGGWEIRNRLSNILIGGIVAVDLAGRAVVETPRRADIKSHSVISHGFQERDTCIRRNIKFQLNRPNHNHILVVIEHILNGGDRCGAIPPTAKAVGFLAPRS